MFCSTLIGELLQYCDVIPKTDKVMFPWDFLQNRLNTLETYSYGAEEEILLN